MSSDDEIPGMVFDPEFDNVVERDIPTIISTDTARMNIWNTIREESGLATALNDPTADLEICLAAIFSNPSDSMESGLERLRSIPKQLGAKCRCDTQWYGASAPCVAFGCKTCALSSASCICVACFDAGEHEGHEFYVSKSEYGCCDCGDPFAWKSSGFCSSHVGPTNADPAQKLDEKMKSICQNVLKSENLISCETGIGLVLKLCSLHDGFRRIAGQMLLPQIGVLLPSSHLWTWQHAWANLLVDLMLDTEFKAEFATKFFSDQYQFLVMARVGLVGPTGRRCMSDLGDFTCQMFTRPDVALALVKDKHMVGVCLETIFKILQQAVVPFEPHLVDTAPAHGSSRALVGTFLAALQEGLGDIELDLEQPEHFIDHGIAETPVRFIVDHAHPVVREQEVAQSSTDLVYLLDHPEVRRTIIENDELLNEYLSGYFLVLKTLHGMNPHRRRTTTHVEFPDPHWSNALALVSDLFSSFWLIALEADQPAVLSKIEKTLLAELHSNFFQINETFSMHCPLNRVLGLVWSKISAPAECLADIHCCLGPSLEAFTFHSQVSLGMWQRNGDSVLLETQFYNGAFFHHHLGSADRILFVEAEKRFLSFFPYILERMDPLENHMITLLSFCLNLLSTSSFGTSLLAVRPRTFSQLRDPLMERWTRTLMPAYVAEQEAFVATLRPVGAEFDLKEWNEIDFVAPYLSWKDMQTVEERFHKHSTLTAWYLEQKQISTNSWPFMLAIIFESLRALVQHGSEFRALRLTLHLILRLSKSNFGKLNLPKIESLLGRIARQFVDPSAVWSTECDSGWSILGLLKELRRKDPTDPWLTLAVDVLSDSVTSEAPKLRRNTQSVQARIMASIKARQAAYLHGQTETEESPESASSSCVICHTSMNQLCVLGYMSRSVHCLSHGRLITRSCGHKVHAACWHTRACPYCTRPANVLLHDTDSARIFLTAQKLGQDDNDGGYLVALFRLISDTLDQIVLSEKHPHSEETDLASLWRVVPLLIQLLVNKWSPRPRHNVEGLVEATILGYIERDPIPESNFERLLQAAMAVGGDGNVLLARARLLRRITSYSFEDMMKSDSFMKEVDNPEAGYPIQADIMTDLPLGYQKLYTKYLGSTHDVLCLLCGAPLRFAEMATHGRRGVVLQLATGLVHIVDDTQVARWGTLYLDAHGEEDTALGKPLSLAPARVEQLRAEIRENSWRWRQKPLQWVHRQ